MIYGEILGHLDGMDFVPFGIPNGAWELPIYLVLSVAVGSVLFNLLKGKYGIALIFFMAPGIGLFVSCISAVRLAKPRSAWAAWLYDRKTMERSIARYEPPIDLQKIPPPSCGGDTRLHSRLPRPRTDCYSPPLAGDAERGCGGTRGDTQPIGFLPK